MESRSVRIGWIIMLIMGAYLIISGFYVIGAPVAGILEPEFDQMAGQSWANFIANNPPTTGDWAKMEMVLGGGISQLAIGALVIMVTLFAYRKGQKWSWYSLLAGGMIWYVGMLIHHLIVGSAPIIPIIGLVLLIIALAVPAKDILSKKSS